MTYLYSVFDKYIEEEHKHHVIVPKNIHPLCIKSDLLANVPYFP